MLLFQTFIQVCFYFLEKKLGGTGPPAPPLATALHMAKFPARLRRSRLEKQRSREPSQHALSYKHIENFTKDLEVTRDLGNRASPVNQAHVKRPLSILLYIYTHTHTHTKVYITITSIYTFNKNSKWRIQDSEWFQFLLFFLLKKTSLWHHCYC